MPAPYGILTSALMDAAKNTNGRRLDIAGTGENVPSHEPEVLVLASGGIDSSALLAFYIRVGRPLCALFVNYGQSAVVEEALAVEQITSHLRIPLLKCEWVGRTSKASGLIVGRNAFLISAAVMEAPPTVTTVALGVHAGTPYADCTPNFIDEMQSVLEKSGRRLQVSAPFVEWTKADVFASAREHDVPIDLTYSCETGGATPCGTCASCLDRERIYVGT